MTEDGFSKSYRAKWENPIFRNLLEAGIWAWMCDTAAWRETRVRFNGELVILDRGQLITSRSFISKGFCVGEQVVRTFLDNLERDGMIIQRPTIRGTIVTLCNYDKYQESEAVGNQLSSQQPTSSQPDANHNKKNLRTKEKNRNAFDVSGFATPDWIDRSLWAGLMEIRKTRKAVQSENALQLIVNQLDRLRKKGHDPSALLETSIRNSWKDIYEPKEKNHGQQGKQSTLDILGEATRQARAAREQRRTESPG
jgi:hypothetical protein